MILACWLLFELQDFAKRMYEVMKEKLGVEAELPSSSPAEDKQAAAAAASEESVEDDTDKSEL